MSNRGTPLDDLYFAWLVKPMDRRWDMSFDNDMLRHLYQTKFEPFVKNDQNRALDGLELRDQFLSRVPLRSSPVEVDGWRAMDCSMLEMFIALADRAAYQVGDQMVDWFQVIIINLGLDREYHWARVRRILKRVNERSYSHSGSGGMFPLRDPLEDQTTVEIWYQMSAYIIENFDGRGVDA